MTDILIIDDEENLRLSIELALRRAGFEPRGTSSGEEGLRAAMRRLPDLVLLDISLPDANGLDVLRDLRANAIDAPTIVITGYGSVDNAVEAMRAGAVDYLQKPLAMNELVLTVQRCLEQHNLRNRVDAYRQSQSRDSSSRAVIGASEAMRQVLGFADRIAAVGSSEEGDLPAVLLLGETGTGKEAVARYIHARGESADEPFVQLNCTAIPETLFESELFGHEAGAFSGAVATKRGLLETATGGTLFLDEIGDMPLTTQAKLLVAIERGHFRRLGSTLERHAQLRVIAATNSDIEQKIRDGVFRPDLFYRLKVFCIHMPPLRERGEDRVMLAEYFAERFARKFRKATPRFDNSARKAIEQYDWPGNVRELANVVQRAVLLCESSIIDAPALGVGSNQRARSGQAAPNSSKPPTFEEAEKQLIVSTLEATAQNVSEAARLLGLTRGRLRHLLSKHQILPTGADETQR